MNHDHKIFSRTILKGHRSNIMSVESAPDTAPSDSDIDPKVLQPEWKKFEIPEVPLPDDTAIEAELTRRFDIGTLFQQMRSV